MATDTKDLLKNLTGPRKDKKAKTTEKAKTIKKEVVVPEDNQSWPRFTFYGEPAQIAKVKQLSKETGLSIKQLMHAMLGVALEVYEKKNGPIVVEEQATLDDPLSLFKPEDIK